jgi:hypothetical protein
VSKDEFCDLLEGLDMHLSVVVSVFCLSAESYPASKPDQSQEKRQNNQSKQLNKVVSCEVVVSRHLLYLGGTWPD